MAESSQVAIVTGGGRGIGAATAKILAANGCRVAVLSRTSDEVSRVAEEINQQFGPSRALALVADVTKEREVADAFEQVLGTWGPVSILVNNAGISAQSPITEMSLDLWEQVFSTNVRGVFLCSKQAFLQMKGSGRGGSIVNVSSLGGIRNTEKFAGFSAYTASKNAVVGFTEALSAEGRAHGIRVNCIAPGAVDTQMLRTSAPFLKTKTTAKEIGELIAFLCDKTQSRPLTAAVIEVHCNE